MSSLIDMVGAAILFGVLLLTVVRVQGNLSTTQYQNTFNLSTEMEAVQIALILEHDFTKAGYGVTGKKVYSADTSSISFVGAFTYGGAVDSIAYYRGTNDSSTTNPYDFRFIRYSRSGGLQSQRLGMTSLAFSYFDTTNTKMSTPVTGSNLAAIRSIDVKFRVESLEPVIDPIRGDTTYYSVTWEKLIYPRNLGKPF